MYNSANNNICIMLRAYFESVGSTIVSRLVSNTIKVFSTRQVNKIFYLNGSVNRRSIEVIKCVCSTWNVQALPDSQDIWDTLYIYYDTNIVMIIHVEA